MFQRARLSALACLVTVSWTTYLHAGELPPDYGIDFVTIGALNNTPFHTPGSPAHNRGSVPYEYRIGRLETTTAQ